jgi:hypothetical protein
MYMLRWIHWSIRNNTGMRTLTLLLARKQDGNGDTCQGILRLPSFAAFGSGPKGYFVVTGVAEKLFPPSLRQRESENENSFLSGRVSL